jgi:DNA polymerase III epsilon subunit-like protein
MLYNPIVVFDLETSSSNKEMCEILEIGAIVLNPRNLKPYRGEEFQVLMQPTDWDALSPKAEKVHKITREKLQAEGVDAAEGWHQFTKFVDQFRRGGKTDSYFAPVPAGFNILGFDLPIVERYCKRYGPGKMDKDGQWSQGLFFKYMDFDAMRIMAAWTENLKEPAKLNMDYLRRFMGFPPESFAAAHSALSDAKDEAALLVKLLQFHRTLSPHIAFKDCFSKTSKPMSEQAILAKKAAKAAAE